MNSKFLEIRSNSGTSWLINLDHIIYMVVGSESESPTIWVENAQESGSNMKIELRKETFDLIVQSLKNAGKVIAY